MRLYINVAIILFHCRWVHELMFHGSYGKGLVERFSSDSIAIIATYYSISVASNLLARHVRLYCKNELRHSTLTGMLWRVAILDSVATQGRPNLRLNKDLKISRLLYHIMLHFCIFIPTIKSICQNGMLEC